MIPFESSELYVLVIHYSCLLTFIELVLSSFIGLNGFFFGLFLRVSEKRPVIFLGFIYLVTGHK